MRILAANQGLAALLESAPMNSDSASAPLPSARQRLRGVLLLLCALFLFACMDTTTKYLSAHYPAPLVVAVRYLVQCLLMLVVLAPSQGRLLLRTQRSGLVFVRGASLALASLLICLALQRMPVAETTAINFLSPMLVVLLAGPLLGERIGAVGWLAAGTGFAGVLLIVHPGGGLDPRGVVYALGAVGAGVCYQLLSRVLAASETTLALLFHSALIGAVGFGIFLPWFAGGEAPDTLRTLLFLAMGVSGGIGHFLFAAAYREAPASQLAPINYLQLLWAALLGWMVFGQLPDRLAIVGMGVVAASGALVALKSRWPEFARRRAVSRASSAALPAAGSHQFSLEKSS